MNEPPTWVQLERLGLGIGSTQAWPELFVGNQNLNLNTTQMWLNVYTQTIPLGLDMVGLDAQLFGSGLLSGEYLKFRNMYVLYTAFSYMFMR